MKTVLISILLVFTSVSKAEQKPKLSTDIKFDGHNVGGKVQSPFESLTEVENEKSIDELIAVRRNFNDRIQKSNQLR